MTYRVFISDEEIEFEGLMGEAKRRNRKTGDYVENGDHCDEDGVIGEYAWCKMRGKKFDRRADWDKMTHADQADAQVKAAFHPSGNCSANNVRISKYPDDLPVVFITMKRVPGGVEAKAFGWLLAKELKALPDAKNFPVAKGKLIRPRDTHTMETYDA